MASARPWWRRWPKNPSLNPRPNRSPTPRNAAPGSRTNTTSTRGEEALAEANRGEQQAANDRKADQAEREHLEKQVALVDQDDTRDMLLDRIREMRQDPGAVPESSRPPLTAFQQQQLEIEQNAGREAVKKAEAIAEQYQEYKKQIEAETKAREGTMTEVHHPNPGMGEQFPAQKATLGKTK